MIPPGHGEPDDTPASLNGRGSNTYTDEDWDDFGAWLAEIDQCDSREERAAT